MKAIAVTRNKVRNSCRIFEVGIVLYSHPRLLVLCVDFPVYRRSPIQNEVGIDSLLPNELVMCAVLNDFPVVQHQNLIGISYGFQTVSNHNDGLASGQGFDGLLQLRLVLGVNIGRGLVQMMIGASLSMARAMESRWRSPPEIVAPLSPMMVS